MLTAILTTYRRPQNFAAQLAALRAQSVSPAAIWAWANEPTAEIASLLEAARLDRVVTCGDNAKFHGRFALALLARMSMSPFSTTIARRAQSGLKTA